jgi:predicted nucleotidyltransferase
MALDVVNKLLELLEDDWDDGNTSSITPEFISIVDQDAKTYDYNINPVVVMAHRPLLRYEKNGVGVESNRWKHLVRLDLRILGKDKEELFIEVHNEIMRILGANIKNPFTGYQELDFENQDQTDLSDRRKGVFRIMIPVFCINYNVAR